MAYVWTVIGPARRTTTFGPKLSTLYLRKKKSKEYICYYDCGGRNVRPAVNLDFDTFGLFPKEEEWRWAQWKWQANGRHRERPQEHTWSRVIFVRREPAYAINRPDFGGHKIQFFPFFSLFLSIVFQSDGNCQRNNLKKPTNCFSQAIKKKRGLNRINPSFIPDTEGGNAKTQ